MQKSVESGGKAMETIWRKLIQEIVDEIDECIRRRDGEALTLRSLAQKLGYSEFYTTRKFREVSGLRLRDYLRRRRLAFALKEVRDSERPLLEIALDYGFSSHEAFTRAFKAAYGVTPGAYRKHPRPVVLRTKIHPFDRYFLGLGEIGMLKPEEDIKVYFVTIPAHKFLYIENRESNGYWEMCIRDRPKPPSPRYSRRIEPSQVPKATSGSRPGRQRATAAA